MIDPREIRIGNYYQWPDGTFFKVKEGNLQDHNFWENASDNIEGIPLTSEWLIKKLGFVCDTLFEDSRPVYYFNDFYIDFNTLQPIDAGFKIAKYDIKFVHELQNLFFDLRKEELILKPQLT